MFKYCMHLNTLLSSVYSETCLLHFAFIDQPKTEQETCSFQADSQIYISEVEKQSTFLIYTYVFNDCIDIFEIQTSMRQSFRCATI